MSGFRNIFLLPFCWVFLFSTQVWAGDIEKIEITDFGLYTGKVEKAKGVDSEKHALTKLTATVQVKRTTAIPAKAGVEFGVEYVILGNKVGVQKEIQLRLAFPTLHEPGKKPYDHVTWSKKVTIGHKAYSGYGFEQAWELVPGLWTISIHDDQGAFMAKKSFLVHKP